VSRPELAISCACAEIVVGLAKKARTINNDLIFVPNVWLAIEC
jgi:hypothetical protein